MAFSKIEITFNRLVEVGENIFFNWRDLDVNGGVDTFITNEVCNDPRLSPGQFSYDGELNGKLQDANYFTAWDYDYNSGNLFKITLAVDKVTIEAKKDNIEFFNPSTNAGVTFVITNEPQVATFVIESIEFLEAVSDKCNQVKVRVTTSSPMTNLLNPVEILGVNNNVVEFDYARYTNNLVIVENATNTRQQSFTTPFYLEEPTVSLVNTPSGATATVSGQSTLNGLEYSLDQITWQLSRVFPGLGEGSFTVYVRDTYGCIKSTAFQVDDFTPDAVLKEPVNYVSTTNSIRFKKDEVWDNNSIFRNDINTLSYEEKVNLCVPFIHKFTDQDVVKTQFKTNYETQEVEIYNCTTKTTDIATVIPVTDNLNKVDKRDANGYIFTDGTNRYGFYFQTGNTYEDDAPVNTISGTYQLFGGLPSWCKIGAYFSVDNGAYAKIDDIVFVDEIQSYVIVSNISYVGVTFILRANYNVFNWDAFEFDINMSAYLNQEIQVTIKLTDSNPDFDNVTFISEKVQVYSDLSDFVTIKAKNTTNNDVVYATGIEHLSRLEFDLYGLADESELEIEKGDDTVYQLNTYSYSKKKLSLTRLSTMVARSIRQQLSLNNVVIDGIDCKIEEIGEPTRIGVTNVYKMEITLYQVENKLRADTVDTEIDLDIVDVPALVKGNDEFIKYE